MSDLRTELTRHFGPGFLAGITAGDWLRLLAENSFHISPRHWGRALTISAGSPVSSLLKVIEEALYGNAIRETRMASPLFVLGSWRSGTTYLHTLLSVDQRFGCPSLYQTMYPHTFLLSEWWWRPMLEIAVPRKRFMDNMKMSLTEPHEDEMALAIMTQRSNMLSWVFPRRSETYDRYLTFQGTADLDRQIWQSALALFVRKIAYKTGRQIVLKSPNHTARIGMILNAFPDARFLHIRRNPFDVYRSMCHMASQVIPMWGLQAYPMDKIPEMVITWYQRLYGAFFEQLPLIPLGQYHEVRYEDLAEHPVDEVSRAYSALGLPDFAEVRPALQSYVAAQAGYRKNAHVPIDPAIRDRLVDEWRQCFDAWGYSRE